MAEMDIDVRNEPAKRRNKAGRQASVEDVKWMAERGWVILIEKDLLWEHPDPVFQCANNGGATTAWTLPQRYRGSKHGSDLLAESCHNCFVMKKRCPRSGLRPSKDEETGLMLTWRVRWTEEEGWDRIGINADGVEVASENARKLVKQVVPSTILHLDLMTPLQLNARLKQCLDEAAQIQQRLATLLTKGTGDPHEENDQPSSQHPSEIDDEASVSGGSSA